MRILKKLNNGLALGDYFMKKRALILAILMIMMLLGCGQKIEKLEEKKEASSKYSEMEAEEIEEKEVRNTELRTVALKGPTAMGMVELMNRADNDEIDSYEYKFNIVAAVDQIPPLLVKKETDLAAVPANLAAVLFNSTEGEIQVLGINTLGVLYIVGADDTITSIEQLKGKTVYASGKGATPEYALNYILSENKINPEKDMKIEWKSEHTECLSSILADPDAVALLPQPFVTTAQMKNNSISVLLDLNKEWEDIQKDKGNLSSLLTGVIIGRKEFIEANPEAVKDFMENYKKSVSYVNENIEEASGLMGNYEIVPKEVAQKAIPYCNITFINGKDMKEKLSGYLEVLFHQNPKSVGGRLPEESFYYIEE